MPNPFAYYKPSDLTQKKIKDVRDAYTFIHQLLLSLPESRERSVAITELETSCMWAIKGLVINDPESEQQ